MRPSPVDLGEMLEFSILVDVNFLMVAVAKWLTHRIVILLSAFKVSPDNSLQSLFSASKYVAA